MVEKHTNTMSSIGGSNSVGEFEVVSKVDNETNTQSIVKHLGLLKIDSGSDKQSGSVNNVIGRTEDNRSNQKEKLLKQLLNVKYK